MDVDQAARSNAQEYFGVKDPDYYEFEGNVSTFTQCVCNHTTTGRAHATTEAD